jgi:N-acetylglucosaminyl-diphospho-decaprenol L-rhamnosyltransferase
VEQENKGFGAGNNAGMRTATGRWYLLLNSDAWLDAGALDALVEFAESHPDAAVVGPRLLNPDRTLQRSVRGFPSVWRIATEYVFLRKLAPRSRALNAFYAGGFEHDEAREAEFLMGSVLFVRPEAVAAVGGFDERYFMFSEETDWCYRFREAGWKVWFFPGAEAIHVGGATTKQNWGPMFREQVRGHLRFLADHRGERQAERARRLMLVALAVRGRLFRGQRGEAYRSAARWLASGRTHTLLER